MGPNLDPSETLKEKKKKMRSYGYVTIGLRGAANEDFVRAVLTKVIEEASGKRWQGKPPASLGKEAQLSEEELGQMAYREREEYDRNFRPYYIGLHREAVDILRKGGPKKDKKDKKGLMETLQDRVTPGILNTLMEVLEASAPKAIVPTIRSGLSDFDVKSEAWVLLRALPEWCFNEFMEGVTLHDIYTNEATPEGARVACPYAQEMGWVSIGDAIPAETLSQMREASASFIEEASVEEATRTAARAAKRELQELAGPRPAVDLDPGELAAEHTAALETASPAHQAGWAVMSRPWLAQGVFAFIALAVVFFTAQMAVSLWAAAAAHGLI